jgi:hypothetical protein
MTDNDCTNMTLQPRRSNASHAIGVLIAILLIKMGAYVALSGLAAFLVYFLCYISVFWWNIGTEKVATAKLENASEISQAVLAQAQRMLRKIESRHSLARNVSSLGAYLLIMSPLLFIPARTYFSILLTFVAILAVVALVSFMRQMMASKKMIRQLKNLGYAEIASMKSEHDARTEAYQRSNAEYAQKQLDQEVLKARINFMRG